MKDKSKKNNAESQPEPLDSEQDVIPDVETELSGKKTDTDGEPQPQSANDKAGVSEKEENDEKYLRLMADFDNFRKRTIRERSELYQRANEDIIEEILPVLDHFDLALKFAAENKVAFGVLDGFRLVSEQLQTALKKSGLTVLDVADGVRFDPSQHEAISHLPSGTVPADMIMTQVRRGYLLGGRILRAAQVVVSSGPQAECDRENNETVISSEGV